MKKNIVLFAIFAIAINTWSCKKNTDLSARSDEKVIVSLNEGFSRSPQTTAAREVFESAIDPNAKQKYHKQPLWDRAYRVVDDNLNIVIVPLKYEKNYTVETNFGSGERMSLEKQSYLLVCTNRQGQSSIKVVTKYPSKAFLDNPSYGFSGFVTEDDWDGNRIRNLKYENGKAYIKRENNPALALKSTNSQSKQINTQTCWYLAHYECFETTTPDVFNCELVDTELLGCEGEKYDELIDGVGGGDIDITDANLEVTKVWPVRSYDSLGIAWTVWSTDVLTGSRSSGLVATFTGRKSHSSSFQGPAGMSHTETGNSLSFTSRNTHVSMSVSAFVSIVDYGSGPVFTGYAAGDASAFFP
ncbi:hypothetical protein [Sediminibacterium ginsengisoli]|uniref:Uncharacterized protein n=1 Tax=Sediminibacterium ginsengisoli TaxID=413434 RepID=A0A1T4ML02_9BACT|nr:hypothetical protein [Sediminibacterium ginsengisoli]SJZ67672.1 hypothetical protein SAMN04488132_103438 [Sediminibacterium ginsengisoli]